MASTQKTSTCVGQVDLPEKNLHLARAGVFPTRRAVIIRWVSIRRAKRFILEHHRHAPKLTGAIICLGAFDAGELVGVAALGRPSARMDAEGTAELLRLCTLGQPNLCSQLYAKAKRLGQALGFVRLKTFTRAGESGASLRAICATDEGLTSGGHWSRDDRLRTDASPEPKRRWGLSE